MSYATPMPPYFPVALAQMSVGRRSSARTRSTGDTSAGAFVFSVLPSGPVTAAVPPVLADGAVGTAGAFEHDANMAAAARQIPTRTSNFINDVSKLWLAECCETGGWEPLALAIAGKDCIRKQDAVELNRRLQRD